MNEKIRIAMIYGSAREGRFCDTVANWLLSELEGMSGFDVTILDPAKLNFSASGPDERSAAIIEAQLDEADAFVIVVPEYNHGYPAALKAIIDSTYKPWHVKPIAFVSYGGISGGLRAVEQLRLVFSELHAVTIRDTVSLAHVWSLFDSQGNPMRPAQMKGPVIVMMRRLLWWARALRTARWESVYDSAAA